MGLVRSGMRTGADAAPAVADMMKLEPSFGSPRQLGSIRIGGRGSSSWGSLLSKQAGAKESTMVQPCFHIKTEFKSLSQIIYFHLKNEWKKKK